MTARLAAIIVDAADPAAVAKFWQHLLGGVLQGAAGDEVGLIAASCELRFHPQTAPKSVKNRVHPDIYVRAVEPLLDLGAIVLAEYLPERVTLADIEGNEFCAFLDADQAGAGGRARMFSLCTDSDQPEELAAWWADQVGAQVGPGTDGTPRWLYGSAGWPELIWKFVRVTDDRATPNRWRWTVRADRDELLAAGGHAESAGLVDPQGNEFELC